MNSHTTHLSMLLCPQYASTHIEPYNAYIHSMQCCTIQYTTIYNTDHTTYHMHSTAAILLSCCYLYCLVPIQSHLITSYLQVTSSHQQHMLCVRMPPIGIHRHVHITTAHSNSTYTSPPPNTNTCTTLAASRDILSMHPCWHTCP